MGTFPHYEGSPTHLYHLIDPAEMQYYLTDKSLAPLRKVPVCIAAAVYRISAGNCMPCKIRKRQNSLFIKITHFIS